MIEKAAELAMIGTSYTGTEQAGENKKNCRIFLFLHFQLISELISRLEVSLVGGHRFERTRVERCHPSSFRASTMTGRYSVRGTLFFLFFLCLGMP